MDLNRLQLPTLTLQGLYRQNLVKLDGAPPANTPAAQPLKFLGGNQKKILVVIKNSDSPFLQDGQLAFLTKILSACKLSLADIVIINIINSSQDDLEQLKLTLSPTVVLMFGITSLELKLPFIIPEFQIQLYDEVRYLTIPALEVIETDQQLKKSLWASFQKLFLA